MSDILTPTKRLSRINGDLLCYPLKGPLMLTYEFSNKPQTNFTFELPVSVHVYKQKMIAYMSGLNLKYYPEDQHKGLYIGPTLNAGIAVWNSPVHSDQPAVVLFIGLKDEEQISIDKNWGINSLGNAGLLSIHSGVQTFGWSAGLGVNYTF